MYEDSDYAADDKIEMLTEVQAAKLLKVPRKTLAEWRVAGTGPEPFIKDSVLRYRRWEILQWIRTHEERQHVAFSIPNQPSALVIDVELGRVYTLDGKKADEVLNPLRERHSFYTGECGDELPEANEAERLEKQRQWEREEKLNPEQITLFTTFFEAMAKKLGSKTFRKCAEDLREYGVIVEHSTSAREPIKCFEIRDNTASH